MTSQWAVLITTGACEVTVGRVNDNRMPMTLQLAEFDVTIGRINGNRVPMTLQWAELKTRGFP